MAVQLFCRLIIFVSAFIQSSSSYNLKTHSIKTDPKINLMINLTEHCFPDIKASVLITDSPSDSLSYDLYNGMTQSVSLLDKSENYNIPTNQNTPVPWIILVLTSPLKVKDVFANETWRDFNQFFLILDGGDTNNKCVNAQSFLMEAWKNDILNAIFLCLDHKNQAPKLFSFNPFTSSAPKSWKKVSVVSVIDNCPWTLLSRSYNPDAGCRDIFFNKVNDLGGYNIKAGYFLRPPFVDFKIVNGVEVMTGSDYEVYKLLTHKLYVKLIYKDISVEYKKQIVNDPEMLFLWERFDNKTLDIMIDIFVLRSPNKKSRFMYPFITSKISVITKHREFTALAGQMFTFLPLSIALLFLVTSIFVFMLLRYLFKDPYSRNFIDILRVYLNFPLPSSPLFTHGRILFGGTLVSFTVANIIVQSNMNTVMTSKNIARNVENIEDLNKLNFTVLSTSSFSIDKLKGSGANNVVLIPKNFNCTQLKDNEALMRTESSLQFMMAKGCHIPNQPILPGFFTSFYTRRNFPAFPKLNDYFFTLFESDLIKSRSGRPKRPKQEPVQYEVITMAHMVFVFCAYIILNFIALIVFLIELFIFKNMRLKLANI